MISTSTAITSLALPQLEPYKTLKRPIDHQRKGIFVAEGDKVTMRLLQSSLDVQSILLSYDWLEKCRALIEQQHSPINVYVGEKKLLETIVGHDLHQSIMAVAKIPKAPSITEVLAATKKPYFFIAVDGIMNSENMGVIVRNCAAFGVQALLVGDSSCDPYLRRSVRNSMGNIFSLSIVYFKNIADELRSLHTQHNVSMIAADAHTNSVLSHQMDATKNCCIVLGSEGSGISEKVLSVCNEAVTIPMRSNVDSLNVANASAVLMYEVMRQRNL